MLGVPSCGSFALTVQKSELGSVKLPHSWRVPSHWQVPVTQDD